MTDREIDCPDIPEKWPKDPPKDQCIFDESITSTVTAGLLPSGLSLPVGLITRGDYSDWASCFLIDDLWIATAAHAMTDERSPGDCIVGFNMLEAASRFNRDLYLFDVTEREFIVRVPELDCVLARLARKDPHESPGRRWGVAKLRKHCRPKVGAEITVVHHPINRRYKCISRGKVISWSGDYFLHSACTAQGSSGAPVFDADGQAVGICKTDRMAVSVDAVVEHLPERGLMTSEHAALIGSFDVG